MYVCMYQVGVKWGIWWKEVDEIDDVRPSGNQSGTVVDWLGLMEQSCMHAMVGCRELCMLFTSTSAILDYSRPLVVDGSGSLGSREHDFLSA